MSWALLVKSVLSECHRTPSMISQHWFRQWLAALQWQRQKINQTLNSHVPSHYLTRTDDVWVVYYEQYAKYWHAVCITSLQTISHMSLLLGVCHQLLKPLRVRINKRNKKKKAAPLDMVNTRVLSDPWYISPWSFICFTNVFFHTKLFQTYNLSININSYILYAARCPMWSGWSSLEFQLDYSVRILVS